MRDRGCVQTVAGIFAHRVPQGAPDLTEIQLSRRRLSRKLHLLQPSSISSPATKSLPDLVSQKTQSVISPNTKNTPESTPERPTKSASTPKSGVASPLVGRLAAVEMHVHREAQAGPVLQRLTRLEADLLGEVQDGVLDQRLAALEVILGNLIN